MPKFPESIPDKEIVAFLSAPRAGKVQISLRVTKEALAILDEEAKRFETGRAKALEAILREIRQMRKTRKR